MSYLCSDCRFSFITNDPCETFVANDLDQCSACRHGRDCHAGTKEPHELDLGALHDLAVHVGGGPVGFKQAQTALKRVARLLAASMSSFEWGEHLISGPEGEPGKCQHCGATFEEILGELGCSAVD